MKDVSTLFGIDYPTLWFLIVGALFSGYAILDGFDFGAGALHLFLKEERSRKIALNAIGPVWDGNEVWLVIGGGALFAGFPVLYASLLSAMYIPFMLFLFFIILRAISIEFRGKEPLVWWKKLWDISYSISSIMLAFLLGVVLGNVLTGIAINENYEFAGNWLEFLNPFALMVGLTTLAAFTMHGAIFLCMKTAGNLYVHVRSLLKYGIMFFIVIFVLTTIYALIFFPHLNDKLNNNPILFVIPLLVILSIANVPRLISKRKYRIAFFFSSLTISLTAYPLRTS